MYDELRKRGTSPLNRLIVTADDFGLATEVNEAVEIAHRSGILSAASLMVASPGAVALGSALRVLDMAILACRFLLAAHAAGQVLPTDQAVLAASVYLMIGFPGETMGMIKDTINVSLEMDLDWYRVKPLQPLPNTPISGRVLTVKRATKLPPLFTSGSKPL